MSPLESLPAWAALPAALLVLLGAGLALVGSLGGEGVARPGDTGNGDGQISAAALTHAARHRQSCFLAHCAMRGQGRPLAL